MTDKEKQYLIAEIERLKDCASPIVICDTLLSFIDSIQEEPVSEDLEEASEEYAYELFPSIGVANTEIELAFKAGAKWQKEQFEKNRLAHCDAQTEKEAEIERDFVMNIIEKEHRQPTFDDAIKYGMRFHKKQMMVKAIDGTARPDDNEIWCNLASFNLEDGDKVKVIVIKEG